MTDLPSDLPDLDALRRNEPHSWDRVFNWLSPIAKKAAQCRLFGYPEEDADEIASATMVELAEEVAKIRSLDVLPTWVRKVARRLAISFTRKSGAQKRGQALQTSFDALEEEEAQLPETPSDKQPDRQVHRRERISLLKKALKKLKPPMVMELIIGFYIIGLSYEDLARKHNLSEGSIGPYLNRGMTQLRAEIKSDSGLDPTDFVLALPAQLLPFLFLRP